MNGEDHGRVPGECRSRESREVCRVVEDIRGDSANVSCHLKVSAECAEGRLACRTGNELDSGKVGFCRYTLGADGVKLGVASEAG